MWVMDDSVAKLVDVTDSLAELMLPKPLYLSK